MLLSITNTCHMDCPHCMDCASPFPQHMSDDIVDRAYDFFIWSGSRVAIISGGELTTHPKWKEIVERFASIPNTMVSIPTNGTWLGTDIEEDFIELFSKFKNTSIQITSVKGIYKEYDRISVQVKDFYQKLKSKKLGKRVYFEEKVDGMLDLGRASLHEKFREEARKEEKCTASCIASVLLSAQLYYKDCIPMLEMKGKFCHPLIDYKGKLHWSESILCPHFADIFEDFSTIAEKAHEWRPCGKCAGYQKFLAKTDYNYVMAKRFLGIQ